MAFKKIWILAILVLASILFSATIGSMMGLANTTQIAVLAVILAIAGFVTIVGWSIIPLKSTKLYAFTAVMAFIALAVGAVPGLTLGNLGLPSASVVTMPGQVVTSPVITQTNLGEAATVTVIAQNKENNDPTTETNSAEVRIYVDGAKRPLTGNSDEGTFTASVGQSYRIVGGNSTMYVDETMGSIPDATATVYIPSHAASTAANMAIACYDTSNTALSAPTNTSLADYNITVGANAQVQFKCKLVVDTSDAAFDLKAVSTYVYNNTKDLRLTGYSTQTCQTGHTECLGASGVSFRQVAVPTFLTNIQMKPDTYSAVEYISSQSYKNAYEFDKPITMQEYDELWYSFTIEGGSTDPAYSTSSEFDGNNFAAVCFHDAVWDLGADGQEHLTWYSADSSQTNLGVDEGEDTPVGKDTCVTLWVL